jgi:hypothetical protein
MNDNVLHLYLVNAHVDRHGVPQVVVIDEIRRDRLH